MASERISLYDPENEIIVELNVSVEDARRAENDIIFATVLLQSALKQTSATVISQQDTDSANIEDGSERAQQAEAATSEESANIEANIDDSERAQQADASTSEESANIDDSERALQSDASTSEGSGLYRWNTEMVLFLLDTYVDRENKFASGKYSQKKIWEDIAEVIRTRIPNITGPQCASKLKSLKKTYKNVKDHNNKSGNDRRMWKFYEKMDTIFNKKAWASPVAVASSSGVSITNQDKRLSDSSPRSSKESVASLLKKRIHQKEEEEVARAKRHKERMEMDREILAMLNKLVDKK